jgi:hypothetical protein
MFSACGQDSTIAATIDGMQIPAGIFINFQSMAYSDAMTEVAASAEETAATTTQNSDGTPVITVSTTAPPLLKDTIDGIAVPTWINDKAIEYMREYAAVEKRFTDLGLSFTDNADATTLAYINQNWEYFEPQLDELGISRDSYEKAVLNGVKRTELQSYYYGKGGEFAISDEDIKKYLLDNYARIDYISMELRDGEGNLLKSEGKAERKAMAEEYIKRAEAGEDFDSLLAEYVDYYAALQEEAAKAAADAAAAEAGTDGTAETATDGTAETATDSTAETADETSSDDEIKLITNESVVYKDGTSPSAAVVAEAFKRQAANPGATEYFIIEEPSGEYY